MAEQGFDALQKYAVDLTALAEEEKIDPVIGRDNEIRRAIRILCRRWANSFYIVLLSTPGFLNTEQKITWSLTLQGVEKT